MKLLYGTSNPGKLQHMKEMLSGLGLEILGLKEVGPIIDPIDESGNNPIENAKIKALTYYKATRIPVFSCDSGLYIDRLEKDEQPGVHIRRINGKVLNDEEMIDYYSNLALRFGGEVRAKYKNAICLVLDETNVYEYDGDDISSEAFIITAKAHPKRISGFPLDSLSLDINAGKYYFDIEENGKNEYESDLAKGFRDFFMRSIIK